MRGVFKLSLALLMVGLATCTTAKTKTAAEYLQEGIFAQEIDSDPAKAVDLYGKVIMDAKASDAYKAQAMLRQGQCYVLLDQPDQAARVLKHLTQTYSNQDAVADKAKVLLQDLIIVDPASIMPPDTLAYIEVGDPGKQIETLLNMLQGTPLEATLNQAPQNHHQGGPQNIGNILQALRNPSMISEFKKIRGLALGITGFPTNGPPPFVGVLFPGKSDALRGLLTVGLQVVAQPIDSIGGLQAYRIENGPAVAFDDKALIIAFPESQLPGAIKQYSQAQAIGLMKNKRFMSSVSADARRQNALTVWVDTQTAYPKFKNLMPKGHMPEELMIAQKVLDLPNVDYALKTLAIQPDGIQVNAKINLKKGHECLAYNLMHTPPLTQGGFEAIPAHAGLIVSMALAAPESPQAQAVHRKLQQLTGLDIGREIFNNVEQISLFVIPGNKATPAYRDIPPIVSQIGIAITSHNPRRTHQLLDQWLRLGHFIVGQASGNPTALKEGQYDIGVNNRQKISCYLHQNKKTTVLSLSPGVIQQSRQAMAQKKNAFNQGPLSATLKALPSTTSKLVLLNMGNAIKAALPSVPRELKEMLGPIAGDLSEATASTVIQINTEEAPNTLGVQVGLNQLPKMSDLLPPIMQLAGSM